MIVAGKVKPIDPKKIPAYLIYEVLNGKKKIEEIRGSSSWQSVIV